jgi:hypothetical protein
MKTENWFQLRIVGVTIIARLLPGFFYRRARPGRAILSLLTGVSQLRTRIMQMFADAAGLRLSVT